MRRRRELAGIKLTNKTNFPTAFLRRMLKWCCRRMDVDRLRSAEFRRLPTGYWRGRGGWGNIKVWIGDREDGYPRTAKYPGLKTAPAYPVNDRVEALLMITLHEVWHCRQSSKGWAFSEVQTERRTMVALDDFRRDRDALLASWGPMVKAAPVTTPEEPAAPVAPVVAKPTRAERNLEKNRAALTRWQRKVKIASTKIRKLRASIRRGEVYLTKKGTA